MVNGCLFLQSYGDNGFVYQRLSMAPARKNVAAKKIYKALYQWL